MSTTKRRAIQILHISTFQFTFKCGYNDFIFKYTDINSLHVTQIDLLHNDTFSFVDTCGTGKRNHAGALVLGNGRIRKK